MNRTYRLIALDMDGTVLNDEKQIDTETRNAIHQALRSGIEVVFCTGRSLAEMQDILEEFPDMNYLCGASGAFIYDLHTKEILHQDLIPRKTVEQLKAAAEQKDVLLCVFSDGQIYANKSQIARMADYQMGVYQKTYQKICTGVEDIFQILSEKERRIEKFNFYHTSGLTREETRNELEALQLDVELVDSEVSSLECSLKGVSKASGLRCLCERLGIKMEEVVMVGDADNDLEAIKAAGLGVAMGNANERVKAVSDLVVRDHNHQGCAQAIGYVMHGGEHD